MVERRRYTHVCIDGTVLILLCFFTCLFVVSNCQEPTSNIDFATDETIQRVIRTAYVGSTMLTIAHRLNTVGARGDVYLPLLFTSYVDT